MEKAVNKMKIYRNINFTLVISHIIITIVILRLYVKYAYADFGMFMKENSTLIWIIYFLSILIVVVIMIYNKKQYQKVFMNEVANNICSKYITDIRIEKEITGLEIVAQNGTSIIPFGNPFDTNSRMQYVKYLDDLVSVEIETDLLQGAELKLQYTIKRRVY